MPACRRTSATANKERTGRHAASMLVADPLSSPSPHIVHAESDRSAPHPATKEGSQLADRCMCAGPRNQADTRNEVESEVQFRSLRCFFFRVKKTRVFFNCGSWSVVRSVPISTSSMLIGSWFSSFLLLSRFLFKKVVVRT